MSQVSFCGADLNFRLWQRWLCGDFIEVSQGILRNATYLSPSKVYYSKLLTKLIRQAVVQSALRHGREFEIISHTSTTTVLHFHRTIFLLTAMSRHKKGPTLWYPSLFPLTFTGIQLCMKSWSSKIESLVRFGGFCMNTRKSKPRLPLLKVKT